MPPANTSASAAYPSFHTPYFRDMEFVAFAFFEFFFTAIWAAVVFTTLALARTVAFAIRLARRIAATPRRYREARV